MATVAKEEKKLSLRERIMGKLGITAEDKEKKKPEPGADDDDEEAKKKGAKPDDEDDDNDPDDPDKDTDDDDACMSVGKTKVNLKNRDEVKSAIEALIGVNADLQTENTGLKAENEEFKTLLTEASEELATAKTNLNKTHEQIKNEIKSQFTPKSGQRSTKSVQKKEVIPDFANLKEGSLASNAAKLALRK